MVFNGCYSAYKQGYKKGYTQTIMSFLKPRIDRVRAGARMVN